MSIRVDVDIHPPSEQEGLRHSRRSEVRRLNPYWRLAKPDKSLPVPGSRAWYSGLEEVPLLLRRDDGKWFKVLVSRKPDSVWDPACLDELRSMGFERLTGPDPLGYWAHSPFHNWMAGLDKTGISISVLKEVPAPPTFEASREARSKAFWHLPEHMQPRILVSY